MGVTYKGDVDAQIPDLWSKRLYSQAERQTFWHRFEGPEGGSMPVIRKDDLTQEAGDTIKTDIVLSLTGAGLKGSTETGGLLEGNEEKMKFRQNSFTVDAYRHGVRWEKLGKILITHDMRGSALGQLRKWLASKLDDQVFAEFTGETISGYVPQSTVPTTAKVFTEPGTTTPGGIDSTDALTLDMISELKVIAKVNNQIEPIAMKDGEEVYGLVLHDYAGLEIKKSTDWKQAQREARERGATNPLFTGALGIWDNVIIYQSERIPRLLDGAASVGVARNIFFGAQALMRGYAYYPDWTEQYFSYGEEQGIGTFTVLGQKLVTFDLTVAGGAAAADFTAIGSLVVYSYAPGPSLVEQAP